MGIRVAINGLGRVGRLVLRHALKHPSITVVAVNDLVPAETLAYLIKYDSTHGRFQGEVSAEDNHLVINGKKILTLCEKDPAKLPWRAHDLDIIVESTGFFTKKEEAEKHLIAGAKRVILSAPPKGDSLTFVPTFVMGVNEKKFNAEKDKIISNASCTTNCTAPIIKVLLDNFGIEEGLLTTIHALTASQLVVDGPSKKRRSGRGALQNIIPATTGAAEAVAFCLPEVKGKLTGMAFRVPVADVSVLDLTVRVSKPTSYEAICEAMRVASKGSMKGIIDYCDEEVVSSDFVGSSYSATFDAKAGLGLSAQFFKIVAWYDNEFGYAARMVDLIEYVAR